MNFWVQLISLGFHGFAAAMLFMGYRLLNRVVEDEDRNAENLSLVLRNIRFFLVVSLVFFVLGVGSEIYSRQWDDQRVHAVEVHLSPSSMPTGVDGPKLLHGGNRPWDEGLVTLEVRDRDTIRLVMDHIIRRIDELDARSRGFVAELAAEDDEGGFSDDDI